MSRPTELISAEQIGTKVVELGRQIAQDYAGQELVLVGVLKGSFLLIADLARAICQAQHTLNLPLDTISCDFLTLQSYGDATQSSGVVQIASDLTRPIEGKHVLLIEDIVDTGLTMTYLLNNLHTRKPKSIRICSLLHKPSKTTNPVTIDYLGFSLQEDAFVFGYGLDLKQKYRHLPYIATPSSSIP